MTTTPSIRNPYYQDAYDLYKTLKNPTEVFEGIDIGLSNGKITALQKKGFIVSAGKINKGNHNVNRWKFPREVLEKLQQIHKRINCKNAIDPDISGDCYCEKLQHQVGLSTCLDCLQRSDEQLHQTTRTGPLTPAEITWLIHHLDKGISPKTVSKKLNISIRRVQQIRAEYQVLEQVSDIVIISYVSQKNEIKQCL